MVRIELTAEASLAAIRARSRLGMAIAAMIRMIATTISNSINEKPSGLRILFCLAGKNPKEHRMARCSLVVHVSKAISPGY